ncbi:MAG: SapC family protein [Pseudomonadota bacterium]
MPRHVPLNNIDHRDLRITTVRAAEYGDDVMSAVTFPAEFRNIQAHYPIVFQPLANGAEGGFQPIALLGLQPGQNLFLRHGRWDAPYVPLAIERQPFLIGFDQGEPVVHVDMDSPRITRGAHEVGEAVFLPYGGHSEYLERVNSVLQALHQGLQATPAFVAALQRHQLLEPFGLEFEFADGSAHRWAGCHTIHEERLARLDAAAVAELHRAGHLHDIYMAVASVARFRDLIARADEARRRALDS